MDGYALIPFDAPRCDTSTNALLFSFLDGRHLHGGFRLRMPIKPSGVDSDDFADCASRPPYGRIAGVAEWNGL